MKITLTRTFIALAVCLAFIGACLSPHAVQALTGVYYIVQENDSLSSISQTFHTSPARIELANYLTDNDPIFPGEKLLVPGFNGLSGTLTQIKIGLGDTPLSLMRHNHGDASAFTRINFLTSPDAIVVGQNLYTLTKDDAANTRLPVTDGMTGLELAAEQGLNPWTAAEYNSLSGPWDLIANDILYLPASGTAGSGDILPGVSALNLTALGQGKTAVFTATAAADAQLSGSLTFNVEDVDQEQEDQATTPPTPVNPANPPVLHDRYPLNLFANPDGTLGALQGVPRMTRVPGTASLLLTARTADGHSYSLQQNIQVKSEDYGYDSPMQVADNFVDPKVTVPEDDLVFKTVAPASPDKLWNGAIQPPTVTPDCQTDTYGKLRSFNGSNFIYWHSGIDYCGAVGDKITAVADGTVIYTGQLDVRGNATIIDHGHGVYSGYYHQSKIEVSMGEQVKAGQEIGLIGDTGRVTGPHLHLDLFVGDVQVDSTDWLNGLYP